MANDHFLTLPCIVAMNVYLRTYRLQTCRQLDGLLDLLSNSHIHRASMMSMLSDIIGPSVSGFCQL
ncbi:hypothetical protein T10_4107 [Trichinella papuae]|uniref:Uncharacterized protein n=1 Tax=Trichinella papuae TaxID=268474 RepID=A0A0V1MNN6_9BILA|nr:hypothetical protein T10_4107 [Trichinella papuae]